MISSISIFSLLVFDIIRHVYSSPGDILGPSACDCYGLNFNDCKIPDTPVESFPKDCSSYLYMTFLVENNTLVDVGEKLGTIKGYLDRLIKTNNTVLVYYSHASQTEWCAAVQCDVTGKTAELNNLKSLLDKHPGVKGIILRSLMDINTDTTPADCPNYSQNLKEYIDLMHKMFENLSIGILISTKITKDSYNNTELAWLDYKTLDSSVDFYVVNFLRLNKCSDKFTKTGCYPLSGNNDNTVDAMKTFLDEAGVPSPKVHYIFYNYGEAKEKNRSCDANPTITCTNVPDANTSICMDTLQTLYDKGAFAKKNGAGFVVNTIDSDDYDCSCQCGQSYPAFYALLSGYNRGPPPKPCALFDRT